MTGRMIAVSIALLALAARADETADARNHYEAGQLHYTLGEFEEAANEFKEAYRLKHQPAILFNIGQAMRKSFQWERAYFYFSQYLKNKPDASNRSEVEGIMVQMKAKEQEAAVALHPVEPEDQPAQPAAGPAKNATAAGPALAAPVSPPPASGPGATSGRVIASAGTPGTSPKGAPPAPRAAVGSPPRSTAPRAEARSVHIAGYIALGLGAGAEAVAFAFHSSSQSKADQFNQKYDARTLTPADAQLKSDAQSKGRLATGAAVGGALLLVTGAVLAFVF